VPNANLYTTAIEGHLLNTISETDEDSHEEIFPAIDGCIPDGPTEGSEPFQNESVAHLHAEINVDYKELSAGPSHTSPPSALGGRSSCSPKHV